MLRKIIWVFITFSFVFLLPYSILAFEEATLQELNDTTVTFDNLDLNLTDSGLTFNYGENYGTTFTHASGVIISTPVIGDNNQIEVQFDLNLILIKADTINLELSNSNINFENEVLPENIIMK